MEKNSLRAFFQMKIHWMRYGCVSQNSGTPKSSILMGFSIENHPFWGPTPIFGNIHMVVFREGFGIFHWEDFCFFGWKLNRMEPP